MRRMKLTTLLAGWLGTSLVATVGLTGCKGGEPPILEDPGDQVAVVGQKLTLQLLASDPEGDSIDWDWKGEGVPDLEGTVQFGVNPDGSAVFEFTPVASQAGSQAFDFIASDGKNDSKITVLIEVRGAVGTGSQPIFRKPLGSGTVLDLEQNDCVTIDIEIQDPDSTSVELAEQPPLIGDANLNPGSDGLTGTWSWCPSREQAGADDRYDLLLSANDGDNEPTEKEYIIVLRKRKGDNCPGEFPAIDHTPMDFNTLQDLEINAQISDDQGLKDLPYLAWAASDPGDPIDFNIMTLQTMSLVSGDMMDGSWRGYIPNLTAPQGEGAMAPMYYLLTASDNDDAEGDCDHLKDDPDMGVHEVNVTNTGGAGAGVCAHCSYDVQCGGSGDLCISDANGSSCGQACDGPGSCAEGYTCSAQAVDSVDGASARQCLPNAGSCSGGGNADCTDDADEDNDDPAEALANGPIPAGTLAGRTLCAGDDDWYAIEVDADAQVHVTLTGDNPPDLDVALTNSSGVLIKSSSGLDSDEEFTTTCLTPGTYLIRAYTVDSTGSGDYSVTWSANTGSCGGGGGGTGDCCADNNSPGCDDPTIESCVCGIDAFCCNTEWDNMCAAQAASECGACGGGGDDDCCTAQMTPGCNDATVQACVCADDNFCCTTQWDSVCVGKVGSLLCAESCMPDDADGACCADNGTPGCEVNSVETCVCDQDAFCCSDIWDALCVDLIATGMCGTCPS
jgi:hypothetical protein